LKGLCGFIVLVAMFFISANVFAQSRTTSVLAGQVEDEEPLPGATVEISSDALIVGTRVATTDEQGRFRFSELPPGKYRLKVTLNGYREFRIETIELSVGQTAEIPVQMRLYASSQTVTVTDAPKIIDPTSSSMQTILPREFLRNIPNDRDTSHILDLA